MNEMLRVLGAILALTLLSAGGANALERTRVEGAIPLKEGVVSPLRPEAVPEAGRELKLGSPAGGRTALHVTLPQELRTERAAQAPGTGPIPVAFHRDLPEEFEGDLSTRLDWTPLGAGKAIAAAMSVTSPGATDMRMGVPRRSGSGWRAPLLRRGCGPALLCGHPGGPRLGGRQAANPVVAGGERRHHRDRDHPAVPGRAVRLLVPRGPDLTRLRRGAARPGVQACARGSGLPRLPSRLPMRSGTAFFPASRKQYGTPAL